MTRSRVGWLGDGVEREVELADLQRGPPRCRRGCARRAARGRSGAGRRPARGWRRRRPSPPPAPRPPSGCRAARGSCPGHQRHADRPVGLHLEGAFGDQAADRLAHRRQADAQRAGDEAEGQLLPRREPAGRQRLAQRVVDLAAQGRVVGSCSGAIASTIADRSRFVITKSLRQLCADLKSFCDHRCPAANTQHGHRSCWVGAMRSYAKSIALYERTKTAPGGRRQQQRALCQHAGAAVLRARRGRPAL